LDGDYIYFAFEYESSGNQIIARVPRPAAGGSIGTTSAEYEPAAGSAGNVTPDPVSPDKMWFFGNFGTDIGIIRHTPSTEGNSDVSPSSIGTDVIQPLQVDRGDNSHIIACNATDQDALESDDTGASWSTLNATLGLTPVAMALAFNGQLQPADGFIAGNDGTDTRLTYTPNDFATLREDSGATLDALAITSLDLVQDND
jgi:hypothetical protein